MNKTYNNNPKQAGNNMNNDRTNRIVWWPWIIASGIIVLLISFAAVAVQSRIAARENPVKNIKQE